MMSKAGSGKPNRLPGMRLVPQNGANPPVPDDLVWDAENPPVIFACSSYIVHRPECDETCESKVLDESGTVSQNLAFAYARAGMSYKGIVPAYEHVIPVRGMRVEVFFLECQVQALTDLVCELANITREEFDVKFRNYRNKIMQDVLDLHEEQSRKQRVADQFGVVEKEYMGQMANHYRKKPVIIEAIQYTLETRNDVLKFLGTEGMSTQIGDYGEVYETEFIKIRTLEGVLRVSLNDWVIRGIKGEFYPCKPDIFEETYELVG